MLTGERQTSRQVLPVLVVDQSMVTGLECKENVKGVPALIYGVGASSSWVFASSVIIQ